MSLPSIKVKLLNENESQNKPHKKNKINITENIGKEPLDINIGNSVNEPLDINIGNSVNEPLDINIGNSVNEPLDINITENIGKEPLDINIGNSVNEPLDINITENIGYEPLDINITENIGKEPLDINITENIGKEPLYINIGNSVKESLEEINIDNMIPEKTDNPDVSDITIGDTKEHNEYDNLMEEVDINNIIEPVDDIKDIIVSVNENNNEEIENPVEELEQTNNNTIDILYLLDKYRTQKGGGDEIPIKEKRLNYFEDESYQNYLDSYESILKEQTQKSDLSKFSYENRDGMVIKKSLKTNHTTTIILPEYRHVGDILDYLDSNINNIVYLLKKKRDDILENNTNKNNFDTLKNKYLHLIKYKKICLKFIKYRGNTYIDNDIILRKKIDIKQKLFNITEKLRILNKTTQNIEETNKLLRDYIELNQIMSLEKKKRENNGSGQLWNDQDYKNEDLRYEKILVKEPIVKSDKQPEPTQKDTKAPPKKKLKLKQKEKEKDKEQISTTPKLKEKEEKPKKLKLKYTPQINSSDSSSDSRWDGPFKDAYLHSGKSGPIIKTPGIKITTLDEAKGECIKIDECKGITEDSSKKKITLRRTDKFKPAENQRSWIKKK